MGDDNRMETMGELGNGEGEGEGGGMRRGRNEMEYAWEER